MKQLVSSAELLGKLLPTKSVRRASDVGTAAKACPAIALVLRMTNGKAMIEYEKLMIGGILFCILAAVSFIFAWFAR